MAANYEVYRVIWMEKSDPKREDGKRLPKPVPYVGAKWKYRIVILLEKDLAAKSAIRKLWNKRSQITGLVLIALVTKEYLNANDITWK